MLKRIRDLLGGRRRTKKVGAPADVPAAPAPPVHRGPNVVHRPIARTDLDPDAVKIVHRLTRFDHSAYFVGGCVRDLLLERKPKDFDIGTSATPGQIKRLFRNCRIIGRRFRLAHIYFQNGKIIEVATFRALDPPDDGESDSESDDLMIRDDNVFGTWTTPTVWATCDANWFAASATRKSASARTRSAAYARSSSRRDWTS